MGRYLTVNVGLAVALSVLLVSAAAAEEAARSELERLHEQLEKRDALISELLQRVEALERRLPAVADLPQQSSTAPPGPGAFEVDEVAAERALERALVERGALLLDSGQAEIAWRFTFRHHDDLAPVIATRDGTPTLATTIRSRDTFAGTLGFRLGLPFESQFELDLPWRHVREADAVQVGFQPEGVVRRSGQGLGDARLGLARTLSRERGWRPELIGRAAWHAPTAKRHSGGVALGGGFHGFEGELVAAKRLDPLTFMVSGSATTFLERDRIERGNQYALALGAFLAASPETSLRLVLQHIVVSETKVDGRRLPGSDRLAAVATAGASLILGRGLLLDVAGDFGITKDAPDYALRVGLTRRFSMPWR
jgi:hypothetical protein